MHARLEHAPVARSDSTIHTLSWNGIIPASEREKSVARRRYCHEGWLATGNAKGVVGATFTTSHCRKEYKAPPRSNFNLRGHNSEVVLVRWNEPYQKLATCDGNGVIFVWIKYEGRWSIELVNDRGSPVSDFNWSHDGRLALICYRDGFVLVGSVAGQRYWSSMLNLEESNILCGVWTPDDKQVLFGTADGQVIVMDSHGAMVAQCILDDDDEIRSLAWSGEKFHMVNTSDSESEVEESPSTPKQKGNKSYYGSFQNFTMKSGHILAVGFGSGDVALMKSYDDMAPVLIRTNMIATKLEWSSCGLFLAVGGTHRHITDPDSVSAVKYYDTSGHLRFTLNIPAQRALTAMTWGHNDKRFFVASGSSLFVAWVEKEVAPLQLLCMEVVGTMIKEEKQVARLPLPSRIKNYVTQAFSPTIKGCIPDPSKLREFVSQTSVGAERLHCTMVRTDDDGYTLYLEYLGGLVPLLKGKKVSKLRPEFVIFDPEVHGVPGQPASGGGDLYIVGNCSCTSCTSDFSHECNYVFSEGASLTLAPRENRCRRLGMLSSAKTSIISEKARQLLATPKNSLREPSRGPPSPKMEPEDIFEPRESIARKANQTLDKHVSIKLTERPGSPREIESNASRCRGPYEDRVVDKGVRGIAEGGKLIHQLCTKCNKSHGVKGQKVKFRSRSQAEQSSDSEGECNLSGDELGALRTKGLTRRKSKRVRSRSEGDEIIVQHEYVLTNKAPLWNESTQVYQLDFGGRVTQESAKNFQVELEGQQVKNTVWLLLLPNADTTLNSVVLHEFLLASVLQFGRIDVNAYTLDFQHPFTALQAFAVALANVTQRLK
uniref:SOCS box domain-containing protein n=1 Tax=Branchiostoma floridae TaxID=7739 RepID=C3ZM38_BRAFL|eukprot:XP_002590284.1 hypothetical protein BRAFLDRAFT_216270 [Branchiostoma floridae]